MNEQDQAAFEALWRKKAGTKDGLFKAIANQVWNAALAHRDIQPPVRLTDEEIHEIDKRTPGGLIQFANAILELRDAKAKGTAT